MDEDDYGVETMASSAAASAGAKTTAAKVTVSPAVAN